MSISEGTPSQRLHRLGLNVIPFFEQSTQAAVAVLSDAELTRRHREIVRERHGGPQRLYAAVTRAGWGRASSRCSPAFPSGKMRWN